MSTITTPSAANNYTDINGLQALKHNANPEDPESLRAVAQQFEGMMLNMMLKSMREANAAFEQDGYFNSNETRFFREMFDQQISLDMANSGGIGLTEILVRQLSKSLNTAPKLEGDTPEPVQGLLHAGRDPSTTLGTTETTPPVIQSERSAPPVILSERSAPPVILSERSAPPVILSERSESKDLDQNTTNTPVILSEAQSAKSKDLDTNTTSNPGTTNLLDKALQAANAAASAVKTFSSPVEFVKTLYPLAEQAATQLGIDPKALLAQAALETGWGKHVIRDGEDSSFNLFGIKADSRWAGEAKTVNTLEFRGGVAEKVRDAFRSYQSYAESFGDYVRFIKENPRYQEALDQVTDPVAYATELQKAGYATDPAYANKIKSILAGDILDGALEGLR